jgi:hypothetical protein
MNYYHLYKKYKSLYLKLKGGDIKYKCDETSKRCIPSNEGVPYEECAKTCRKKYLCQNGECVETNDPTGLSYSNCAQICYQEKKYKCNENIKICEPCKPNETCSSYQECEKTCHKKYLCQNGECVETNDPNGDPYIQCARKCYQYYLKKAIKFPYDLANEVTIPFDNVAMAKTMKYCLKNYVKIIEDYFKKYPNIRRYIFYFFTINIISKSTFITTNPTYTYNIKHENQYTIDDFNNFIMVTKEKNIIVKFSYINNLLPLGHANLCLIKPQDKRIMFMDTSGAIIKNDIVMNDINDFIKKIDYLKDFTIEKYGINLVCQLPKYRYFFQRKITGGTCQTWVVFLSLILAINSDVSYDDIIKRFNFDEVVSSFLIINFMHHIYQDNKDTIDGTLDYENFLTSTPFNYKDEEDKKRKLILKFINEQRYCAMERTLRLLLAVEIFKPYLENLKNRDNYIFKTYIVPPIESLIIKCGRYECCYDNIELYENIKKRIKDIMLKYFSRLLYDEYLIKQINAKLGNYIENISSPIRNDIETFIRKNMNIKDYLDTKIIDVIYMLHTKFIKTIVNEQYMFLASFIIFSSEEDDWDKEYYAMSMFVH